MLDLDSAWFSHPGSSIIGSINHFLKITIFKPECTTLKNLAIYLDKVRDFVQLPQKFPCLPVKNKAIGVQKATIPATTTFAVEVKTTSLKLSLSYSSVSLSSMVLESEDEETSFMIHLLLKF